MEEGERKKLGDFKPEDLKENQKHFRHEYGGRSIYYKVVKYIQDKEGKWLDVIALPPYTDKRGVTHYRKKFMTLRLENHLKDFELTEEEVLGANAELIHRINNS